MSETPTTPDFQITLLELRPGDVLVAKCRGVVTKERVAHISQAIGQALPKGITIGVLIIDEGMDLSVLRVESSNA
jgi:hypothetical protein